MFQLNDDMSIYATRGDVVFFELQADDDGKNYKFQPGDLVRIKVFAKKDAEKIVLQKDFPVAEITESVEIYLTKEDTKIGEVISKPVDYWYEIELNPDKNPQTIVGYDEDGAKIFKLFPEGDDVEDYIPTPEDFPVVDTKFDLTSPRPIANQTVTREFQNLFEGYKATHNAVANLYVTPEMFGAIGDGVADDTEALGEALLSGKNIHLPEGVYVTNKPLYVNVNTTNFNGESSKSVIKAGNNFPQGEAVITFYSPDGDYYDRSNRERVHGHFAVVGNNKTCDGVRIGGAVGSDYEGHVEASIFENIFVDNCNAAFLWGAHTYRNTLIHCDSHNNNYSLKTASDITDSGEVFTCINCGFWSGALYLANCGEVMMYACTIHTTSKQEVDGLQCSHYFKSTLVNFQNCHIEAIVRNEAQYNEVRPATFYAHNALVYFNECLGVVTGNYITVGDPVFYDNATVDSGVGHGIYINGGQWKYYLGRVKTDLLTRGCVEFSNIELKYIYDSITYPYRIYEHTRQFSTNENGEFDYYYKIPKDKLAGITVEESEVNSQKCFKITNPTWFSNAAIGFYQKVDVSNYKTCKLNGMYYVDNSTYNFTLVSSGTAPSIIMFADMYGNLLSWGDPNNATVSKTGVAKDTGNALTVEGMAIAIPSGAKYAFIGFDLRHDGGMPQGTVNVYSTMTYEFI